MILFYVSGHGFGHATRTRAVIEAVLERRPRMPIAVRSQAPGWLFGSKVQHELVTIEPAVVEAPGALQVDATATARGIHDFAETLPDLVRNEANWVRSAKVRTIFADIPFVAGFVGKAAGVPTIAGSNFLWNWILEGEPGIEVIAEGYSLSQLALRYPLSHDEGWDVFPASEQVPLVTPQSRRDRRVIRAELGIDGSQPAVLIAGRAAMDEAGHRRLRETCPEFRFLNGQELPSYHDLIRASDVVVSKAGYSIVAECIAERKPLLYPPRTGFREEGMLLNAASRLLKSAPISEEDWRAGNWREGLRRLLAQPEPPDFIDTHGAETCAEILIRTAV